MDQIADLKINMTSTTKDFELIEEYYTTVSDRSLMLHSPTLKEISINSATLPCLGADIALYFRPGLMLQNLQISSASLSLFVASTMGVKNSTVVSIKSGGVTAYPFVSSRKTYINSNSGSISGSYGLYDVLSIRSTSGSISVDVDPKEIDKDHPAPAVFSVHSNSGSVRVDFPFAGADIPERDYHSNIISQDGSINGRYIHGSQTSLESQSASIDVSLLPYSADDYPSTLHTKSNSGSQKIDLLSPYDNPGSSIKRLSSTHSVSSGQLVLSYPDEWEGKLSGQTSSGSLNLRGNDLEIIEQGSRGGGKYVVAKKGDGESVMKFNTQSGSVDANIGF
jgi:hypothetical protein